MVTFPQCISRVLLYEGEQFTHLQKYNFAGGDIDCAWIWKLESELQRYD